MERSGRGSDGLMIVIGPAGGRLSVPRRAVPAVRVTLAMAAVVAAAGLAAGLLLWALI